MRLLQDVSLLVIDDHQDVRNLLHEGLSLHGAEVFTASGPAEARRLLGEITPSAIICDLMMPREGGIAFISKLRKTSHGRVPPIVVLSASANPAHEGAALEAGARLFLKKPISVAVLADALREALSPKALARTGTGDASSASSVSTGSVTGAPLRNSKSSGVQVRGYTFRRDPETHLVWVESTGGATLASFERMSSSGRESWSIRSTSSALAPRDAKAVFDLWDQAGRPIA